MQAAALFTTVGLTVAVYWAGLFGPFMLDDFSNIVHLAPRSASASDLWLAAFGNESGVLRRPVSNLSFALNFLTSGEATFNFKATNLAIHVACGFAIYALVVSLARTTGGQREAEVAAWTVATLWLLHPLNVSTVLYVVQRMSQLSCLFVLVALLAYTRWRASRVPLSRHTLLTHGTVFSLAALLGVLSKENAALLPILVGVVEVYLRSVESKPALSANQLRWLGWAIAGSVAALALAAVVGFPWLTSSYAFRDFSMSERLATQPVVLAQYLLGWLWPTSSNLGFFHDDLQPLQPGDWSSVLASAGIAAALIFAVVARKRFPGLSLGIAWFFASHAMESTFLPLELKWEHRNYLAIAGLCAGVVLEATRQLSRHRGSRTAMHGTAAILTALLAVLTYQRSLVFSDEQRFATHEYQRAPYSARAHLRNLEVYTANRGDPVVVTALLRGLLMADGYSDRSHFVTMLMSCAGTPPWPAPWAAVSRATHAPYDPELVLLVILTVNEALNHNCALPLFFLEASVDGLMWNPEYSTGQDLTDLLILKAKLRHLQHDHLGRELALINAQSFRTSPVPQALQQQLRGY